jgi:hypothetical protein
LKKGERTLFDALDLSGFDMALSLVGSFNEGNLEAVPEKHGLIVVGEESRFLFVGRNDNLRASAQELVRGPAIGVMANHFWRPDPARLNIRFFAGEAFERVTVQRWQLKMIVEKKPVFNWPIHSAA